MLSLAGVLLAALIVTGPGRIDRRTRVQRLLSLALLIVLIAATFTATVLLIHQLIRGGGITKSGGPAAAGRQRCMGDQHHRVRPAVLGTRRWRVSRPDTPGPPGRPDLAFPQHLSPEVASAGWRPLFFDYLYLGPTSALAFSPTDTMPMARWAKTATGAQSLLSIAVLGLVIARAVNIFA